MRIAKREQRKYGLLHLTIVIVLSMGFVGGMVLAVRPNYVYDWEGLLTDGEIQEINSFCAKVDTNTTVEIVTITLKSFDEPLKVGDIDGARVKYFNDYRLDGTTGIGKLGKDNGILIIFSLNEGYWGIEVGYGLEGDLTDSESGRIGRDILLKNLEDEMPGAAVLKTCEAIAKEVGYGRQEVVIVPDETSTFSFPSLNLIGIVLGSVAVILLGAFGVNRVMKSRAEKESQQKRYVDDKITELSGYLTLLVSAQDRTIQTQNRMIQELKPKPIIIAPCPKCQADRRSEVLDRETREILEDSWYWSFIYWGLTCLTCGAAFTKEGERKKGESLKARETRLKKEVEERKRREEEERRRQVEEKKRREEESKRRREEEAERSRRSLLASSSSSRSSHSSSGSFGSGRSGGGGASGRIR